MSWKAWFKCTVYLQTERQQHERTNTPTRPHTHTLYTRHTQVQTGITKNLTFAMCSKLSVHAVSVANSCTASALTSTAPLGTFGACAVRLDAAEPEEDEVSGARASSRANVEGEVEADGGRAPSIRGINFGVPEDRTPSPLGVRGRTEAVGRAATGDGDTPIAGTEGLHKGAGLPPSRTGASVRKAVQYTHTHTF